FFYKQKATYEVPRSLGGWEMCKRDGYNTGLGNTQIAEALARHRREGDVCWITHERYNTTRQQLAKGSLALTLDQNTRQHAQLAIDLMLRHLESGYQPQTYADGKVDFILYSAENVD
ncbi:hypothetical protein POX17_25215, partial [Klebsiella pneumoniae]